VTIKLLFSSPSGLGECMAYYKSVKERFNLISGNKETLDLVKPGKDLY
jgi:hypothetical protein